MAKKSKSSGKSSSKRKKQASKKSKKTPGKKRKYSQKQIDQKLTENFIGLQKVMANMAKKFDNLSGQISKLLELFEISAKALAEKDYKKEKSKAEEKQIKDKLDNLMEQNKVIARGLTLMNEKILEQPQGQMLPQEQTNSQMQSPQRQMPPKQQLQMRKPKPQMKKPIPRPPQRNQQQAKQPQSLQMQSDSAEGSQTREVGSGTEGYQKSLSIQNPEEQSKQKSFKKLPGSKNQ